MYELYLLIFPKKYGGMKNWKKKFASELILPHCVSSKVKIELAKSRRTNFRNSFQWVKDRNIKEENTEIYVR